MDRLTLIQNLRDYNTTEASETEFKSAFLKLLAEPNAFNRSHLPGHVTGSSWIIDKSGNFVLLTHHAKLNRWLQPGGHADDDENVLRVALREASEETGISDFKIIRDGIFDLDIHLIPARKDFPEHLHYDIRYLLQADKGSALRVTAESHSLAWIPVNDLSTLTAHNESLLRMARKVSQLF